MIQHWLMKSEPNVYGIDDLEKHGISIWEGCRNYQVRNTIRDLMKVGDEAFFYHSNLEPIGIVGHMKIVSESYPDPTQFDPSSKYYDPKSNPKNPRWFARDVEFISKFPRVISLQELKTIPGLEGMEVIKKGQRLSVMPVTPKEWEIVMKLVQLSLIK